MTAPVIAFFNNKGGVGKTSLVYHLAWMYAEQGYSVIVADLDPQANLTSAFLAERDLERLWSDESSPKTVFGSVSPIIEGTGYLTDPPLATISEMLALLPGDLSLSSFEDELSSQWPDCLDGKVRAFRVISAFWRVLDRARERVNADVVLVDVGPNLGAINRAALVAADNVVIPLAPDLFSVQGLRNLGPTLRNWRRGWRDRLSRNPDPTLPLPTGEMSPLGYVLLQHGIRLGKPVKAYQRWMTRIPDVYRRYVLDTDEPAPPIDEDPYCLAQLKHYHSLMPMAQDARKPVFHLTPADGAFGGHQRAVSAARGDFDALASAIRQRRGPAERR